MAPIFLNLIGESGDPLLAFFLQFTMACLMGTFGGSMIPWLLTLFPAQVRLTSISFAYNCAAAIVGGFSPMAATLLVEHFNYSAPGYIISVLAGLAWVGLCIAPSSEKL